MLALLKRSLGGLALGDVDNRSEYHESLIGLDRVQADLDREFATVLLAAEEIAPEPHRPWPRIGEKTGTHFHVTTAESFRNEHFYGLTQQLGARIFKYPLGLSIHQDNLACPVDHHHGVRRSLDNKLEASLRSALVFRLVPGGEFLGERASCILPHHLTCRPAGFARVEMIPPAAHLQSHQYSLNLTRSSTQSTARREEFVQPATDSYRPTHVASTTARL